MSHRSTALLSRRWAPLVLLVLSGIVSLAILEFGARWLHLSNVGTPYVREDPDTIYAHIPNKRGRMESPGEFAVRFVINSKGLRSPEIDYPRAAGERVLAIGDSFTFGVGVEDNETWPAALNGALNRAAPAAFETLNAGVQGWGLAEYWIWLEKEGVRYSPDWIVIGVHASDWTSAFRGLVSLNDAGELEKHQRTQAGLASLKDASARIPLYETVMDWSVLANYLKTMLAQRLRGGTTQGLESEAKTPATVRFAASWPVNSAILLGLEQSAREVGAQLAFVFIPTWEHVRGEPGHEGVEAAFRDALGKHAREHEIAFVDMTLRFRETAAGDKAKIADLYHTDDGHCTAAGYARIADAAAELIGAAAKATSLERHP